MNAELAIYNGKAMENYLRLAAQLAWRAVDEDLPDDELTVLVATPDGAEPVFLGYKDGECWRSVHGEQIKVSHWLPLPEPPTEGGR